MAIRAVTQPFEAALPFFPHTVQLGAPLEEDNATKIQTGIQKPIVKTDRKRWSIWLQCCIRQCATFGGCNLHRSPSFDSLFSYDIHLSAEHSENEKLKDAFKEAAEQLLKESGNFAGLLQSGRFF
jgi:hypothetical protein